MPIRIHVYYIGRTFDLDKLSEMVYSLFTEGKDYVKTGKIAFKYEGGVRPNKNFEKAFIEDIEERQAWMVQMSKQLIGDEH